MYSRVMVVLVALIAFLGINTAESSEWPQLPENWGDSTNNPTVLHEYLAGEKIKSWERMTEMEMRFGKPLAGQEDYDVSYYKLEMSVDVDNQQVDGRVTMRATALVDGFTTAFVNLTEYLTVDAISVDGAPVTINHWGWEIHVDLPAPANSGDEFEIVIDYSGNPQEFGRWGFWYSSHGAGVPVVSTLSEPYFAQTWWPCKDRPDDKADSVDIIVETRADLFVSSNGILREVVDNGATKTYHWHEQYPITTYLVSLAISNYAHFREWYTYGPTDSDSMPVDYYPYPEYLEDAMANWTVTPMLIEILADRFGEYPFVDEKYAMTHFSWGGAMEHQTNTSATEQPFGFDLFLVGHELAHQWWGDYITIQDWGHIWLNEGFATYSEALIAEALAGTGLYRQYMDALQYWYGGTIYVYDISSPWEILHIREYHKGAWVLHMLRGVVGDEDFFNILKAYYNDPSVAHGDATTEEFRDIAESVCGRELDAFFDQWIYDELYPKYEYGFVQDPATYDVQGFITQVQPWRPVFEMPIQLQVNYQDQTSEIVVVENTQRDQTFAIDLDKPIFAVTHARSGSDADTGLNPSGIVFDPYNYILDSAKQYSGLYVQREGFEIDDATGNGNGRPDPGESNVELTLTLKNRGVNLTDMTVTVSTVHPEIVLTQETFYPGAVAHGELFSNSDSPVVMDVDESMPPTIVDLMITVSAFGGTQSYTDTLKIHVGPPQALIVDDDQGVPSDYARYFTRIFDSIRVPYMVWVKEESLTPPPDTLQGYPMAIWLTGDRRSEVLTAEDVTSLTAFLDAGGRALVTGQDIAEALTGSPDETLLTNYFHVEYQPGPTPMLIAEGIEGDPISDGQWFALGGAGGAANQNSPDRLLPLSPRAKPIYTYYNSNDIAAVRVRGDGYRVVFCGFGMEAIADGLPGFTKRSAVFDKMYTWLMAEEGAYLPGDVNSDSDVSPLDVVEIVNYVFRGDPDVPLCDAMDVNGDCTTNPIDVMILVSYVYKSLGTLEIGCAE